MMVKIALVGNPNSGKTTLFNLLTGSSQTVGNWPGVTVEKKSGKVKNHEDVYVDDLPGIYSLSPYTLEEVVARDYLASEKVDVIINIIDATNLERNLYLSTQIFELGIPVVMAFNMIDVVRKNGDIINLEKLSESFGVDIIEISALHAEGIDNVVERALLRAQDGRLPKEPRYSGEMEHIIAHVEDIVASYNDSENINRYLAIKVLENDALVLKKLNLDKRDLDRISRMVDREQSRLDEDMQSIITNERYNYVTKYTSKYLIRMSDTRESLSVRIDNVVTHKYLAIPIFIAIIFSIYFIAISTIGAWATDFTNDVIVAKWIQGGLTALFGAWNVSAWIQGLVIDGIVGGVGSVIGFVPQILVLSFLMAVLEDIGYMARIAFIMDRVFRRFGLSGKSIIPLLISTGCGVPGILATRTIESQRERRITIITTTFIPCSAKIPIIALIGTAVFNGAWWIAPTGYFVGIMTVAVSGIILKKMRPFAGSPAPFVMEMPTYHLPLMENVIKITLQRGLEFVKKAVTVILLASVVLWFLQAFGFQNGQLAMVTQNSESLLADIGNLAAPLFEPLGFGKWQATIATFTGLIAKENLVSTIGVVYDFGNGAGAFGEFTKDYSSLQAFSFLLFNLLCAPCFASIGAIYQEMKSLRWTVFAVSYMTIFAYVIAMVFYQLGTLIAGGGFTYLTAIAIFLVALLGYLFFKKAPRTV